VLPVERRHGQEVAAGIETTRVDVVAIRMRAGAAERVNAAGSAEAVFGNSGIEPVGDELLLALQQLEILRRHDQVDETLLRADRAIARERLVLVNTDSKADFAAVAAA